MTETRAAVFYCPFCAEEDLHPVEQHGGWECRSCLRVFAVESARSRSSGGIAGRPDSSHGGSNDAMPSPSSLEDAGPGCGRNLEGSSAEEIVRWATETFGDRFAVTASMSDGVLSHVAGRAAPASLCCSSTPATTFPRPSAPATPSPPPTPSRSRPSRIRCACPSTRPNTAVCTRSIPTSAAPFARSGPSTGRCVHTTPGRAGFAGQSSPRAPTRPSSGWDAKRRKVKVNPLATWTDEQVDGIRRRARHPGQPAAADRLHLHRLRAMHPAGGRRRRRAVRPVGRAGEVRVRDPLMSKPSYPLVLDVAGRRVVVVGGGPVAARRACARRGGRRRRGRRLAVLVRDARRAGRRRARPRGIHATTPTATSTARGWSTRRPASSSTDDAVAAAAEAACVCGACAPTTPSASSRVDAGQSPGSATCWWPSPVAAIRSRVPRCAMPCRRQLETGSLPLRRRRAGGGSVALVGGGPGDPGLITTRGRQLLAQADVVVVDRLAPRALLDELDPDVVVVDVGKTPGQPPGDPGRDQPDCSIEHAAGRPLRGSAQGRRPVRSRPRRRGSPGLPRGRRSGRGRARGDERVAVPAAVGIPVTHRGLARQFTVVSGHDGLDWPSLGTVEGTLVLLMGVSRVARDGAAAGPARP